MSMRNSQMTGALAACTMAVSIAGSASGQRLVDPGVVTISPTFEYWGFVTPFVSDSDSLAVSRMSQLSLPLAVSVSPVRNWRVDIAGSYAMGEVRYLSVTTGAASTVPLRGLTDTKVRLIGRLVNEQVWLTLGANIPTGRARLSGVEGAALRILGAPAFRMVTPVLGSGFGGTAGIVFTTTFGGWAVGLGGSYELRGSYTPLESAIAGSNAVARLNPAAAAHFSLGFDRLVGQGRISLQVGGDYYGTDLLAVQAGSAGATSETAYQLGPSFTVNGEYHVATRSVRDFRVWVTSRYRTEFRDATGERVPDSNGNFLDLGFATTVGRPGALGISWSISGVIDTGMEFDNTVATAAMSSARAMVGFDIPIARLALQPHVNATYGLLDLGPMSTDAIAVGAGITLRSQW